MKTTGARLAFGTAAIIFGSLALLNTPPSGAQSAAQSKAEASVYTESAPSGSGARNSNPKIVASNKALKALGHIDAAERRAALIWLAEHGLHIHAIQIAPLLKDEDLLNRQLAEQAMWQMWARSGNSKIDRQYSKALTHMNGGDFTAAIQSFSGLIKTKPDLAEAWNKRATAYFLAGDLDRSLADCDEVIKRNPVHFGALAGYGQIYAKKGDYERALEYFNQALDVNPNMVGVQINIRGLQRLIDEKRKNTT